jgi:hypothetical protein
MEKPKTKPHNQYAAYVDIEFCVYGRIPDASNYHR